MCNEEEGHFDAASFCAGFGVMVVAAIILLLILLLILVPAHNTTIVKEAELPKTCVAGEQVLMTTAPVSELYICETHWVRR